MDTGVLRRASGRGSPVITVPMLAAILAFIATSWRNDRVAASLFILYAAWVAFATVLNAAIFKLN